MFTTRPDTLFGATFMVLAPEHPFVDDADHRRAGRRGRRVPAQRPPPRTRSTAPDDTREKTGVFTGSFATNPVNGEQIPIWIADYVLMGYGTGAIMAVPCGDQRDFEFARKFGLPIPAIQRPPVAWFDEQGVDPHPTPALDTAQWPIAYVGDAPYVQLVERHARPERHRQQGRGHRGDQRRGSRRTARARRRSPTSCATGCSAASATGASRSRSCTTSTATRTRCPTTMLPVELPETDSFSPRTFDADDEFSNPESPLDRLDDWVERRRSTWATARSRTAATPT